MARQEQHESNPGGGPMTGVGMQAPALSPGGSRTGMSSSHVSWKKRGGSLTDLLGSPSAGDAMQGRSPGSMNFMNGMQPPDFNNAMFMGKDQQMMAAGGPPNMRPPTSDMGGMRPQNARMNNQFQGGQPMTQQLSQGGQTMGTPNQRGGDMPPPQAPTGGPNSAQRNQTGSPSNANAPPTPSQTNKPNPKNKKAKEEASRKVSACSGHSPCMKLTHMCSDRTRKTQLQMHRLRMITLLSRLNLQHRSRRITLALSMPAPKVNHRCKANNSYRTMVCRWANHPCRTI